MKKQKIILNNEKGSALVLALVFVSLVATIIAAVQFSQKPLSQMQMEIQNQQDGTKMMEMYALEVKKGIDLARIREINSLPGCTGDTSLKVYTGARKACMDENSKPLVYKGRSYTMRFLPANLNY